MKSRHKARHTGCTNEKGPGRRRTRLRKTGGRQSAKGMPKARGNKQKGDEAGASDPTQPETEGTVRGKRNADDFGGQPS